MALNCNSLLTITRTRTPNESVTQNKAAVSILLRFRIIAQTGTNEVWVINKGGGQFYLGRKSGSATIYRFGGATASGGDFNIEFTPVLGQWHTAVFVFDSTLGSERQKLFVDGVKKLSTNAAGNSWNTNESIQLGPTDTGIHARHDEFCVWSRALTEVEAIALSSSRVEAAGVTAGRMLHYDFHAEISGTFTGSEPASQDLSESDLDMLTFSGSPTWVSDDPFVVPVAELSLSLRGKHMGSGTALNLGTWPMGSNVSHRFNLTNNGSANLTVSDVSVTGDATLVSTGLATTYAGAEGADVIARTANSTTGAKSFVVTAASDDPTNPTYSITVNYLVQSDAGRTLAPHASWNGAKGSGFSDNGGLGVAIPTASATNHGTGFDGIPPAVAADTNPFDWVDGNTYELCVATDTSDLGDIAYVDFYYEGTAKRIYTKALSSRSGVEGYLVTLTATSNGVAQAFWRVVPVNGKEVVGHCWLYWNTDGSLYGTVHNLTPATDLGTHLAGLGTTGKTRTRLAAGTYTYTEDIGFPYEPSFPHIIELAPGVAPGEVVIVRNGGLGDINIRPSKIIWRGVEWNTSSITQYVAFGNYEGRDPDEGTVFENCRWIDPIGPTGPERGYTTLNGTLRGGWFNTDRSQRFFIKNPTVSHYNGLCGGVSCVYGGQIESAFDFLAFSGSQAQGKLAANIDLIEAGRMIQRCHIEQEVTVGSTSGASPTTITVSGTPTIQELYASSDAYVEVLTGTMAGQILHVTGSDTTARTFTVSENASALVAGDKFWVFQYAHPNIMQTSGNFTPSVIFHGLRADIDYTELFRLDKESTVDSNRGIWWQRSVVKLQEGHGIGNVAAWEWREINCGFRQCTFPRAFVPEVPNPPDTEVFDVTACAMYDTVITEVTGNPGSLTADQYKFRFDNNNYKSGTNHGSNSTVADPAVGDDGRPEEGSPLLNRLYGARLRFDAYGVEIPMDGSGPIGGASVEGMDAPTITSASTKSGQVGAALSYTITATGTAPITFGVSGTLPDGVTFDGANTISGTPTTAGAFEVTLSATNDFGTDIETLTFTVNAGVATGYVVTPPSSIRLGSASRFVIRATPLGTAFDGTTTVTLNDNASGGTWTPESGSPAAGTISVTPPSGAQSFIVNYATSETRKFTAANNEGWSNPSDMEYATAAGRSVNGTLRLGLGLGLGL